MANKPKGVTVTLTIKEEVYEKLVEQLKLVQDIGISSLGGDVESVSELISYYLEQMYSPNQDIQAFKERLEESLHSINNGDLTMETLLNSFGIGDQLKRGDKEKTGDEWVIDDSEDDDTDDQ